MRNNMKNSFLIVLSIISLWGLWGFFSKLAVQKISLQTSLWTSISLTLIITAFLFFTNQLVPFKKDFSGIAFAVLAGIFSALGSILFYILLGKKPVGLLIAITALYPLITILLATMFLKESLTLTKIVGLIFAIIALFILNL